MDNKFCKCGCGQITPIAKRNRYELGHVKGKHIDYLLGHKMRGVTGKNHFNYKGDNAGYKALHLRVSASRGKADKAAKTKKMVYGNSHIYKGWETRRGVDVTA